MKLTKIYKKYEELNIRDMSEVEIQGAILYLYKMIMEDEEEVNGEAYSTLNDIDNITYYCSRNLQIQGDYYIKGFYVSSIFMVEHSYETLFCLCSDSADFKQDFVCRIDLD